MNKTLILVISILISMDITFAQNKDSITIRTIQESELKSEYLIAVYKNFQRTFFWTYRSISKELLHKR